MSELFTLDINGESWKVLMIASPKDKSTIEILREHFLKVQKRHGTQAAILSTFAVLAFARMVLNVFFKSEEEKEK